MREETSRLAFIDALKAVASQLIVWHHLAFYGPMSDQAYTLAPGVISWLSQYARVAVQAFLVIGGFLAAQSLAPSGTLLVGQPLALLWKRYRKLAFPYLIVVCLAIACAAIARLLMDHDSIPGTPTAGQVVAHAFLLQSVLGYDGLSAGVWYIAIDFQLFALLLGMLWLARCLAGGGEQTPLVARWLVAAGAIASLFWFNRQPDLDVWGIYFFGAYALGVLTYWATNGGRSVVWLAVIAAAVVGALSCEWRLRIAVALAVALAVGFARVAGILGRWPQSPSIARLGQISYSVFLVHFPLCLIVNGLFIRFAPPDAGFQLAGMFVAWLVSVVSGAFYYDFVESRLQGGCRSRRSATTLTSDP